MDNSNVAAQVQGTTAANRVKRVTTFGALSVSRVFPSQFKEGVMTAEIKQTVTEKSYYPSKSVANDLQDNIFTTGDFGFADQEFTSNSTRVAWIDTPVGSTVESVAAQLAKFPQARIMRVLSNKPILNENQKYAITRPELNTTLDTIADNQVVRYSDQHETEALRGTLIFDNNGKIQYKANFFRTTTIEDEDRRTAVANDFYASPTLKAEIAAMAGNVEIPGAHVAQNEGLIPQNGGGQGGTN